VQAAEKQAVMVSILTTIPVVIGLLGAAIVLPWDRTIITDPFIRNTAPTEDTGPIDVPEYTRRTVYFPSHGLQLEGWLYIPKVRFKYKTCNHNLQSNQYASTYAAIGAWF
jgi:hypothetical protein